MLTALTTLALANTASQLVDSALPTTREFWRLKMGATLSEATDPRPFADVIAARAEEQR